MTVEQTACILCTRNCGLRVDIDHGRITSIRGNEAHPVSKGYLCQKAARLAYYQENADRLEHPLRRESGGRFVRVGWDEALTDIAARLKAMRKQHGGSAFAFYGGGGQGNHLGGAYSRQLMKAMSSRFVYSPLAQEKTGDFWVNGRLFGDQRCHITEDVEHADVVLFIGTNPYQSHGIPNARDTLRAIKSNPARTMIVVDPRKSETARLADIHLQVRPGTDAFLMAAMLAMIVRDGLHDTRFLSRRCAGFSKLEALLRDIPVEDFVRRADVPLADAARVARTFATAPTACVRVDLGLQHSLHSTLNSFLEKMLFLVTGNFGRRGGNNLHSFLVPILGHSDERMTERKRTARYGMFPIAGMFPPNILPGEIEHDGSDRVRAMFVDSGNPVLTGADTTGYERAFSKLELLVVVDVAMTETARLAHYVLPAATQFEKWECTGFTLEFPDNAFHLRHPVLPPRPEALPEPEIYTRLLEAMGEIPRSFPLLQRVARVEPGATKHSLYLATLGAALAANPKWAPYAASIVYRTLGPALRTARANPAFTPPAAAAPLLALAIATANREPRAVRRAGHHGSRLTLGSALFQTILDSPQGTTFTKHQSDDVWRFIAHRDGLIHLDVPEMLAALLALRDEPAVVEPLVLAAGERRTYNANQIFRDPSWRRTDKDGSMRVHPSDAARLGLAHGALAVCTTKAGELEVTVSIDDSIRPGMVVIPHGYGARFDNGEPDGPQVNRLTSADHCDPLAFTPYHKHIPAQLRPASRARTSS